MNSLHGRISWTATSAYGVSSRVDAVYGEMEAFDGNTETLLVAVAALGRERLGLSSQCRIEVVAFCHRADGSIEKSVIAAL